MPKSVPEAAQDDTGLPVPLYLTDMLYHVYRTRRTRDYATTSLNVAILAGGHVRSAYRCWSTRHCLLEPDARCYEGPRCLWDPITT